MSRTQVQIVEVRYAEVVHEGHLYKVQRHGSVQWWDRDTLPAKWSVNVSDFPHDVDFIRAIGLAELIVSERN